MRIMALDVGDRRIGVALSDPTGMLASPNTIIERTDESADIRVIIDIAKRYEAGRVIVGLPISLNGTIGDQAEKVHAFVEHMVKHIEIPVELRDERMTTVSAKRLLREGRGRGKTGKDDAAAAAVLLQGYLDEKSGDIPNPNGQ
jgi:putative holliday junction resolvase